jgi:Fe-S-cluster containining protein
MPECEFETCKAECCRYVSVYLKTPRSNADFDEIRWFVTHEHIRVYRDHEKNWMIEFTSPCKFLDADNICRIYANRPEVCAEYNPNDCTFHVRGPIFDKIMFTDPGDVDMFLEERRLKRNAKRAENARKNSAAPAPSHAVAK